MSAMEQAEGAASAPGGLAEIEAIIGRARDGGLTEDAALEAIGRIISDRVDPPQVYQKPWG